MPSNFAAELREKVKSQILLPLPPEMGWSGEAVPESESPSSVTALPKSTLISLYQGQSVLGADAIPAVIYDVGDETDNNQFRGGDLDPYNFNAFTEIPIDPRNAYYWYGAGPQMEVPKHAITIGETTDSEAASTLRTLTLSTSAT